MCPKGKPSKQNKSMNRTDTNIPRRWSLEYWSQILWSTACFLLLFNGCSEILTIPKSNGVSEGSVEHRTNSLILDNSKANGWGKIGFGTAGLSVLLRWHSRSKKEK